VTQDASQEEGQQETFISHLVELRTRLLRAAAAVIGIFIVLFIYPGASAIYDVLAQPMLASLPEGTRMIATGVITPFMVPVKVTMMAAFILALPVVLYQAWAFVAPGLYRHEKRLALPLIVSSRAWHSAISWCSARCSTSSPRSRRSPSRPRRTSRPT
jgi:sec-independent protein translocase protein TatC